MNLMLDTNIFNHILDEIFELSLFPSGATLFATKVQYEELKNTSNIIRRDKLLQTFIRIDPEIKPALFAWNIPGAGWSEGVWATGEESDFYDELYNELEKLKSKPNNTQDAIIATIAYTKGYILVTEDGILSDVARKKGITVCQFCRKTKSFI